MNADNRFRSFARDLRNKSGEPMTQNDNLPPVRFICNVADEPRRYPPGGEAGLMVLRGAMTNLSTESLGYGSRTELEDMLVALFGYLALHELDSAQRVAGKLLVASRALPSEIGHVIELVLAAYGITECSDV